MFKKKCIIIGIVLFDAMICKVTSSYASAFLNFDDFPVTPALGTPGNSPTWTYVPELMYGNAGWQTAGATKNYFFRYNNTYNNSHMGFETYGYLEIDGEKAVHENSLRYVITGGKNSTTCPDSSTNCNAFGTKLLNKETYVSEIAAGLNPVATGETVGAPYIYFANSGADSVATATPFDYVPKGTTRLSFYMYVPPGASVGPGGYGVPVRPTIGAGPYTKITSDEVFPGGSSSTYVGGHWYNQFSLEGGGWAKMYIESHPEHNNGFSDASKYPYPSSSLRSIGPAFFEKMYKFYINMANYEGVETVPYSVWFDEFAFETDIEPQNNETMNNPAVIRNDTTGIFNVSITGKYKNLGYCGGTYQLRYSSSPITNANWDSATPTHILADSRFSIKDNANGIFSKWWSGYVYIWAPFKLQDEDQVKITNGQVIYFALKDISQVDGDGLDPVATGGRKYGTYPASFDYAGDKPVLKLIKRFDYTVTIGTMKPKIKEITIK